AFFNDEPAVKALNLMGIQVDTFGNHNFDKGTAALQTLMGLSQYKYVSSNLMNLEANLMNVASPFTMFTVGGVKVGVVGITNPDAPTLLFPGRLGTLTIAEPAPAAMAAAAAA